MRRWTTDPQTGVTTMTDPWWSVRVERPHSRTCMALYVLKLGPVEVLWIPSWRRHALFKVQIIGTRQTRYLSGGCF